MKVKHIHEMSDKEFDSFLKKAEKDGIKFKWKEWIKNVKGLQMTNKQKIELGICDQPITPWWINPRNYGM